MAPPPVEPELLHWLKINKNRGKIFLNEVVLVGRIIFSLQSNSRQNLTLAYSVLPRAPLKVSCKEPWEGIKNPSFKLSVLNGKG